MTAMDMKLLCRGVKLLPVEISLAPLVDGAHTM